MRPQLIISIIFVVLAVSFIGWGLISTSGSESEVKTKIEQLTPPAEKKDININVLNQKTLTDTLTRRSYGSFEDNPNVGRDNPFEGI
jgi:hypothetical protein